MDSARLVTPQPAVMPMDARREGDTFVLQFDVPGVHTETIHIEVETNVLTICAERPAANPEGPPSSADGEDTPGGPLRCRMRDRRTER